MRRNRIVLFITVLTLTLALAAMAQAPGRMGGQGMRGAGAGQKALGPGGGDFQRLAIFLALSETQIAQWQAIREEARAQAAGLVETRKANAANLRELLGATNPDPLAVGTLVVQNHALGTQIRAIHEAAQEKFVALLNDEQKAKYAQFLAFRSSHPRRGPGGQGFGGGPGAGMGFGGGFGFGDGTCPCCED